MNCMTQLAHAIQTKTEVQEITALWEELEKARSKFPSSDYLMTALTEEVGELAKAFLDEPMANVRHEALQVACVAMRIYREGDPSMNSIRQQRGLDVIEWPTNIERENMQGN